MNVLSNDRLDNLEFFEAHHPVWALSPTSIGLTSIMVTTLAGRTSTCRLAYDAMLAQREASKAATLEFYNTYRLMTEAGRDDIRQIKAFADMQGDPTSVYIAAQIPVPLPPGPAVAPGTPLDFRVELNPSNGFLTLKWKVMGGTTGGNVFWLVNRIVNGEGESQFVGGCGGEKAVTDEAVPVGTNTLKYTVVGRRGATMGEEASVTVQLGHAAGGGGMSILSQDGSAPVKMAA